MKVSIVGSLRDREVACSASDRQGSNFESCVWRTVSSQSSHHPQEVLLAQFSLYVHKGGLKPDSFHFISFCPWIELREMKRYLGEIQEAHKSASRFIDLKPSFTSPAHSTSEFKNFFPNFAIIVKIEILVILKRPSGRPQGVFSLKHQHSFSSTSQHERCI